MISEENLNNAKTWLTNFFDADTRKEVQKLIDLNSEELNKVIKINLIK